MAWQVIYDREVDISNWMTAFKHRFCELKRRHRHNHPEPWPGWRAKMSIDRCDDCGGFASNWIHGVIE